MSEKNETKIFRAKSIQEIKKENKKNKKVKEIKGKKILTGFVIVLCAIALIFLGCKLNRKCLIVSVGENTIGVVEDKDDLRRIEEELKKKISEEIDVKDIEFNEEIKTEKQKYDKTLISPDETIMQGLQANLTYKIEAYVLNLDDEEIALFENSKQLNRVLNKVRNDVYDDDQEFDYIKDKNMIKEYFYGNLTITNRFVEKTELTTDDILVANLEEKQEQKTYKVRTNDSLVTIAEANDMTVEELVAANRGFSENQILRVGQEINLVVPMAKLAVVSYVEQSYETIIDPAVNRIIRDDQYEDFQNVLKEGTEGKKRVTVRIKMVGDTELSKEIIKEEEIQKAEDKEIEVGSKKLPTKAMKGLFMMPTVGIITAEFFESRDGYNHKGVDIANSRGTNIYASYVGTVTYSGEKNDFGNLIIITHSSGYETYYAHCDELLVEKGTKVQKGDLIAKMGTTGDSTGNHLHFELRKDGEVCNPFDYIY